jgi:rhombotail lipoprotein
MSKKILILLQILFTITCSSRGMDRGKLPDVSDKNIIIDDSEIKKYSSLKPQLKMPFRVGIYLVNPEGTYYRINGEDKSHLLSIENELKEYGIINQIFFISASIQNFENDSDYSRYRNKYEDRTPTLDNIKSIRILASRYGADAVLIIKCNNNYKQETNLSSLLYLTIAGIWLVPGSERDSLFEFTGTLWDVKNEYLYFTSESDSRKQVTRPLGFIDDEKIVAESKKIALEAITNEIKNRFKSFK